MSISTTAPDRFTSPSRRHITAADAASLRATLGHDRWNIYEVVSALRDAHPDAGYDPNVGGGVGQILAEHHDEAVQIARDVMAKHADATQRLAEKKAAEADAKTARSRFARIRDALKAGQARTTLREPATPEAYARAKAEAAAEQEAAALHAEGAKEAATAGKRVAKVKADAVAAAKADPPTLPREELDAAVADAKAAIDRVRAIGAERDKLVRQHGRAFAAAGFEARWGAPAGGTGIQENGTVWVDGTSYGPGSVRSWLAEIRRAVREIR